MDIKEIHNFRPLNYEDLLIRLGNFGKWHFGILSAAMWLLILNGYENGIIPFMKYTPHILCYNSTKHENSSLMVDVCDGSCTHWQFDDSVLKETFVTQWNLICDRKYLVAITQSVYFGGYFLGSIIGGMAADRFGRRPLTLLTVLINGICGIAQAFSPNFWLFMVLRFLNGAAHIAITISIYTLLMEVHLGPIRTILSGVYFFASPIGSMVPSLIGWLIPDWRYVQLICSLSYLVTAVVLVFTLPESPRWLLSEDKAKAAENVITSASKWNNVPFKENIDLQPLSSEMRGRVTHKNNAVVFLQVFRQYRSALMAMNLAFCWLVNSLVFYGVLLNIDDFFGSIFLNSFILHVFELIGSALEIPLVKWGRKKAQFSTLLICGILLLAVPWVPSDHHLKLITALVGYLFISASFTCMYVYTAELYPTEIRSSGMGFSSMGSRFGGLIAPQVAELGTKFPTLKFLPMIIYGASSIGSALLICFMPETVGRNLPETVEEMYEIKKKLPDKRDISTDL